MKFITSNVVLTSVLQTLQYITRACIYMHLNWTNVTSISFSLKKHTNSTANALYVTLSYNLDISLSITMFTVFTSSFQRLHGSNVTSMKDIFWYLLYKIYFKCIKDQHFSMWIIKIMHLKMHKGNITFIY